MLTSRAWWFLLADFFVLAVGVFGHRRTEGLIGFTLLFWFLAEWLLFTLRAHFALPSLRVLRSVGDERGRVASLWAGHIFHIRLEVRLSAEWGFPYLHISDQVPLGVEVARGQWEWSGSIGEDEPVRLHYCIRCGAAGKVRFEGLSVRLADLQGFFYHETFLAQPAIFRVLPPLADARGNRPSVKRHNLLPAPGVHRHLRPGSGSELLDLRDYLPGDPPKTIAWKVSARRDRLITKEFESEVPLRCTFFLDASQGVRLGPPGRNALARLIEIAAAAAQAATGARDLTGLCIFDEKRVAVTMRPSRGPRHLVDFLNHLADAAALVPATTTAKPATLLPLAYSLAQRVYPNLLRQDINRVPFWLPYLWPLPAVDRTRTMPSKAFRWFFILGAFLPFAGVVAFVYGFGEFFAALSSVLLPIPQSVVGPLGYVLAVSAGILYYALLNFLYPIVPLLGSKRVRKEARWRKRLAALLATRHELGPGGWGLLMENDRALAFHLQRFLAEHHVPYPIPLYDEQGRYLFAASGKPAILAQALLRSVGKGRDNELFVLLVDLYDQAEHLAPLIRAVKVALARHHQVVVICAWPPGMPLPPGRRGKSLPTVELAEPTFQDLLHDATVARLHHAFLSLRQEFTRLAVPVVCAAQGDPVRLILDRLDRLRTLTSGRKQ
jgi:uncharacterized protein (DUF58 family)